MFEHSTLIVNRLVVTKERKFVYDQVFYAGINIIRGENGTGKSTVIDLLCYSLGTEFKNWTTEQECCDYTFVEVLFNNRQFTLKRKISSSGKEPMDIFEGNMDDSFNDSVNWSRYPSTRSTQKESYSQRIFELLGLPQHKTDESQNLTVHQIMRLIYVDQVTQTTQLLNSEIQFDKSITRKAIGEYLLGLDDLAIHSLRQKLINEKKEFEDTRGELKAIYNLLGATHESTLLDAEMLTVKSEIKKLEERKGRISSSSFDDLDIRIKEKCIALKNKIETLSSSISHREDDLSFLTSEVNETTFFLSSLNKRLLSLNESQTINEELGNLSFKFCPLCLCKISEHKEPNTCSLCKSDISKENRIYSYIQMANELKFQIIESNKLIEDYNKKISFINLSLPHDKEKLARFADEYRNLSQGADIKESAISEVATAIGFYQCDLLRIKEKLDLANQVDLLENKKTIAAGNIESLERQIEGYEANREERKEKVYNSIEAIAKEFLIGDGGYEESFKRPEVVSFDFGKDKMFVNGRSKFSASSMVVMKNAIRSAIFFNSILDEASRFPRFFILDNVEDKGMAPDRSQNFQRLLVNKCKEYDDDFYQLIFTTSMIDPELDKSDFVVGPHYFKGMHTLNF